MNSKQLLGVFALLAAGTQACPQSAQHGVWVPGFQQAMPGYWTGTLNLAKGSAMSEGGWIDEAWLYIRQGPSGAWIQVNHWSDDPDPGGPMSMSLSVAFDSTHFNNGDFVFVKFKVVDVVYGILPTVKESAPGVARVHNMAYGFEHHDANAEPNSHGGVLATAAFEAMNYQKEEHFADSWVVPTVESNSYDAAALYFNSHCSGSFLYMDDNTALFPSDVLAWRNTINGTGLPPFNSTGLPFTSFVLLDVCSGAADGRFNKWFWPYYRGDFPGTPCINQALFGYSDLTYWNDRVNMASLYWPMLEEGRTVVEMRNWLVTACAGYWNEFAPKKYVKITPAARSVLNITDCPIWGDPYARLKGVYTGNTTWPVGWYRAL